MEAGQKANYYQSQHFFTYPFTIISPPKKSFSSQVIQQPSLYQVYCPISCKKVKIGAHKGKHKEGLEFNTTSNRWVSTMINKNIRYLINQNPPNKKDKRTTDGQGWGFWIQVSDKGNYAIFNPYCYNHHDPLTLYTFAVIPKFQNLPALGQFTILPQDKEITSIKVAGKTIYLKQSENGSFISTNTHFGDQAKGMLTFVNPSNTKTVLSIKTKEALKVIPAIKAYWLHQLSIQILAQKQTEASAASHNLDQIYEGLGVALNLEEQLRAKLSHSSSMEILNQKFGYHPRLYSAISRLTSFINYGVTKHNTRTLAELGFYNKSDILQDLAYFEYPQIPIPFVQDPTFQSQRQIRSKLFPFSRMQRGLPNSNVPLNTFIEAIMHQEVSKEKISFYEVCGPYLLLVDQKKNVSVWSCRLFPVHLFTFWAGIEEPQLKKTSLLTTQKDVNNLHVEKEDNALASLFDEDPSSSNNSAVAPPKKPEPAVIVPDPSMIEQMVQMGYGLSVVKKALIAVKNDSVPAALDVLEQIKEEDKKKKKAKRSNWNCSVCTFLNRSDIDTCEMCGEMFDFQGEEEKQRIKLEKQAEEEEKKKKQEEKKIAEEEAEAQKLKRAAEEAQRAKKIEEKQQILRKSELVATKLLFREASAIDPFFIIQIFFNDEKKIGKLKVTRVGISRQFFSRFYHIEETNLSSYQKRFPYEINFDSFEKIAADSIDQREWGINLIESQNNNWGVVQLKQVELADKLHHIEIIGDHIIISQNDKSYYFKLQVKDSVDGPSFDIHLAQKPEQNVKQAQIVAPIVQNELSSAFEIEQGKQIKLDGQISQLEIEVLQHLPAKVWKQHEAQSSKSQLVIAQEGQVVMNELLPLAIEHFQGSSFSSKHYSTTMLEKSQQLYISNYPKTNFTFRHLRGKPIYVESVIIQSSTKRLQRIFSVCQGLIFTADQPTWFHLAKQKFQDFTKVDYQNWLTKKKARNDHRQFWQPVGYFQLDGQAQAELDFKRTSKYVFLLPTNTKGEKKKDEVYAIKIDFFGVKGRVEEDLSMESNSFKNQGSSGCAVELFKEGESIGDKIPKPKSWGHINSFSFHPSSGNFVSQCPLSTTSLFKYKFRKHSCPTSIKVLSKYSKKITLKLNKEAIQEQIDSTSIKSFAQLAGMQNQFSITQIQAVAEKLSAQELLQQLLKADRHLNLYESLITKLDGSPQFRQKLLKSILEMVPLLVEDKIEVTERGFKVFMALYQKQITGQPHLAFVANTEALKNITRYVRGNRNQNYNILRLKYNIEELVLETSYFSKQYYRLVNPNYVEQEPQVPATLQPTGPINCILFVQQLNNYYYRQLIDLQTHKKVESIRFFVPKITALTFRPKLALNIWAVDDNGQRLVYSRYFHEELLVSLGVYGFKDSQIYRGQKLNSLVINDFHTTARFIKVQYSFLLTTTQPHLKYKDTIDKFILVPLVEGKDTKNEVKTDKVIQIVQSFPQEPKHVYNMERLPPCKYNSQGNKSMFAVYEFPVVEPSVVKQGHKDLVQKITTNIMDENIVRQAVKNIKISQYQFNHKGIDFAYTYILHLMTLTRKFPVQMHISVELMLQIFDILVVFEAGPIMKKSFAFLQDNYKRLSHPQKAHFSGALINKYLSTIENLPAARVTERYSPIKIIEKLQQFQLLLANIFSLVDKSTQKSLKILLVKLISHSLTNYGTGHLELYSTETGKYLKNMTLKDLITISFKNCLWILANVSGLKEQALAQGLDLLLMFLSSQGPASLSQCRSEAVKQFVENIEVQDVWKLVFLTIKLKCEPLKAQINKLFTVITSNLTQKFKRSINEMLQQIIMKQEKSLYVAINPQLTEELWMNHLQTTLELVTMTKDSLYLDLEIALKLLQLPLTTRLWSLALTIIPRKDEVLTAIIKNFPAEYYNSLGKEITHFCQPLAGIRSLDSIHINWLDLVKQIRLQGKNVFCLFVDQLEKSSFGGKNGLTMASTSDIKNLQVACELAKLVADDMIKEEYISQSGIRKLLLWYFLNKSKDKGISPATDKILLLSQTVKKILTQMSQNQKITRTVLRLLLQIRRQGEVVERNFTEKRVLTHASLVLNRRFSQCFEQLLSHFMTNDQLCSLFAFDMRALDYLLKTMDIQNHEQQNTGPTFPPDEQLLINEKLIAVKSSGQKSGQQIKEPEDMKEEEFANSVKLMPNKNLSNINPTNPDWTIYKKGNKNKIIFLPMLDPAYYHEHALYVQFTRTAEIRSIKCGFTAASYEFNDKLVATPSSVILEGSLDGISFQPIGQMDHLQDDAYIQGGVQVWVLNCEKLKGCKSIVDSIQDLNSHRAKYLKIVVKRPTVTFIQGAYSQLNGRHYNNLGCSLTFLSVTGDDVDKMPVWLSEGCKQISKRSALRVLSSLLSQNNARTMRRIANDEKFAMLIKSNFKKIKQYMVKYPEIMPQVVYLVGAGNRDLGDWIVSQFLKERGAQIEAKIVSQIILSTPDRALLRLSKFLESILLKMLAASQQNQIQAGLIYSKEIHFIQSFCKTLQESYDLDLGEGTLDVNEKDVNAIINIYDRKNSSPQIKSAVKLLINLLHLKPPLKLKQELLVTAMDTTWNNCTDDKSHFYQLMSALLVDRRASNWLKGNNHKKIDDIIDQTYSSCTSSDIKKLKLQLMLLSQISHHEPDYLREKKVHIELYNRVKTIVHQENDITQAILKLMKKVVLSNPQEEKEMARLLFEDVSLLVKKRDPHLQKLFVGLLGLQQEVMISLKGLQLQSAVKKQTSFNSKWLNKKQNKQLLDKINKKYKYSLLGEISGLIKVDHQELFLKAFSCNAFLMVLRFKLNQNTYTCGVFNPTPGKRNQEGDYFWQEIINYEKQGFIFFMDQNNPHFFTNEAPDSMLGNIYGGDQEQQNAALFYDDGFDIMQFTFSTGQPTYPRLNLTKYKKELASELTGDSLDNYPTFSFIGLQFWDLKVSNTIAITDSKITNLLSKSNQAKPPFSFYRTAPIYIFPANITISKFMNILGVKGVCESHSAQLQSETTLFELEKKSTDFVIDLSIQSQEEEDKTAATEMGYIPLMNIFNHFSSLNGVVQVLRLGSESIKEWKKPDRKKNFEHYMDELRSFINLPSFFNLFIKNQQYVTLLFEVASGMPDDQSSTRNWEDEYVNNFRYIYKIVSDIFKFDRSPSLRNMDPYADFVEVILQKLSHITKQFTRTIKQDEEENKDKQKQSANLPSLSKNKSQDRKKKKKGTGYGADNQNNQKWSASEWLQSRKNVSQETLRVSNIIASFLDCEAPLKDETLSQIIKESCLLPILESALRSGSLLDISKDAQLFRCYLQIIRLLASHPSTIECVLDLDKKYKPEQSQSIYSLFGKLNGTAAIFSECLKSGKEQLTSSNQVANAISIEIQKTYQFVDKSVKDLKKRGKGYTIKQLDNMPIAESYRILLSGLRFGHCNMKEGNVYKHAHSGSISSSSNPPTSKILRLSQELADLSTSLPCEHTNSIFLRCDQTRIDVIQILVMGSKDTPYANGAFVFDVYCDDSYPNNPPKMLITTTGQGKIRFNPNLYSCGKVCLSLLGTWRGSASQNWDPKVSTLLQLFISTQGITMSEDVYFNEPGFEGQQGTEEGDRKNEAYSNIVRLGNLRYAMVAQLKNPPRGFQEVVKRHFYIKKKEILQECDKWVKYAQKRQASYNGLINDHNSSWCAELKQSKTKYKQLLLKQIEELKKLLDDLPPPNLKEESQDHAFVAQKKQKGQIKAVDAKLEEVDVGYQKENKEIQEVGQNVFQDRWSRYIGAMGLEAVKKQAQSSVLLIGLKPLGLQIAKNLVLSGLKKLTIVDNQKCQSNSEHFYMANMKSTNIQDCIFKIKELNPYMTIEYSQTLPQLDQYSVVVSTQGFNESKQIAQKTRKLGIKFIYTQTKGASGIYFADLGAHQVNDDNGEEPFEGIIKSISNEEQGLVTLLDGVKHPYQDGDYIVLSMVDGMDVIQQTMEQKTEAQIFFQQGSKQKIKGINNRVFKIKVQNWNSFRIGDTRQFSPYKSNGLCRNIKIPKKHEYETLEVCSQKFENYLDPNLGLYDYQKMGDNLSLFLCFKALSQYRKANNAIIPNWSVKQSKAFVSIVQEITKKMEKSQEETQAILKFANQFSYIAEAQLPTIGAYLGGIVSQQVVKAITNKFMPIKQFWTFHFNQLVQKVPQEADQLEKLFVKKQQNFRNLKIVVGREGVQKVQELKTFVIGAGAIGCELLKNFAMVNMGAKGQIMVTDPDHIETSNLSRQFLFRDKHVKKAKSATACATLLQLNPQLEGHLHARLDRVGEQTEQIYSNEFFKSRGAVANALDNVKARQYMDKRCVQNKVPLFESGTLGPKGHVQVIVPFKTQNYGSQNDPSEQSQIPHCTLKMFPQQTVHCIEWSRDIFGKIFTLNPKALKKVIEGKDLKVLEGQERQTTAKMIKYRPESFDDCIAEAVRKFYSYYRNNVRQLLFTYPIDMKTKDGKPFWTLPKRPPKQINELDYDDEVHRTFISSYAVLLAKTYSLPFPKDFRKKEGKDSIMKIAIKVKVQDFVPNQEAAKQIEKQVEKENKISEEEGSESTEPSQLEKPVSEEVQLTEEVLEMKPVAEEFEKDEDSNGHIDLIYSMSNLRCRNYGLAECTWIESKLKAGKILAALSTTTSAVAALQTIQMIKLVTGCTVWRNGFANLAVPIVQITEPGPPPKYTVGNASFTVWDQWVIKASTLKEVQKQLKQTYQVEGYNISTKSGQPIYWEAMYADKQEARQKVLSTKLGTMFQQKEVELSIAMRKVGSSQAYQTVPKVKIEIQQ